MKLTSCQSASVEWTSLRSQALPGNHQKAEEQKTCPGPHSPAGRAGCAGQRRMNEREPRELGERKGRRFLCGAVDWPSGHRLEGLGVELFTGVLLLCPYVWQSPYVSASRHKPTFSLRICLMRKQQPSPPGSPALTPSAPPPSVRCMLPLHPDSHISPDHATGFCTNTILDGSPVALRVSNCIDGFGSYCPALLGAILSSQLLDHSPDFSPSPPSEVPFLCELWVGVPHSSALHRLLSVDFLPGSYHPDPDFKPCTF